MASAPILVTGAAGLIGGALVRRLLAAGRSVIATDLRAAGASFQKVDLQDGDVVAALVSACAPGVIVHCGAVSGPMGVASDPCGAMKINVLGALNILEAARLSKVARVIALSSIAVYGDQDNDAPVGESASLNARDIYGASKIAMEAVLRAYRESCGLSVVALRVSSVYGPGRTTPCFVRDMIASAASGAAFRVSGADDRRRQFVHIDDVVQALVLAIDAADLPAFACNIGGGTWLTERKVAQIGARVLPNLKIVDTEAPGRGLDGRMGPLDGALAQSTFGYAPQTPLERGIAAYAEHLKQASF